MAVLGWGSRAHRHVLFWFSKIVQEARVTTHVVQLHLAYGMILFIDSE